MGQCRECAFRTARVELDGEHSLDGLSGYRWLPLRLDDALMSWRVLKQAGRIPFILSALGNAPLSFVMLPKLDVVGSSPIARSLTARNMQLLNWPADLGRLFYAPATVTTTETARAVVGYRCLAIAVTASRISLFERRFQAAARAHRLVRLP